MKIYNIYNEKGAYLGTLEAEEIHLAVKEARKKYPLEPIVLQEVKRYKNVVEGNKELQEEIRGYLNSRLKSFYQTHKVGVKDIEIKCICQHHNVIPRWVVSDVKTELDIS
jgi:GTP cyclohydrolase I